MDDDNKDPSDFCYLNNSEESRLSAFERLTLTGGSELERAITWIAKRLINFSALGISERIDVVAMLEAAQFYAAERWQASPADFFIPPSEKPQVTETKVHGLADGEIVDLEFASSYQVQNKDFLEEFTRTTSNHKVFARWWRHGERAKATIVAVHGWSMGDQRLNSLAFLPGMFYRKGLDVVLIELPYHGRRKPEAAAGTESSEFLFPSTNVLRTNEAMGQAISDLRALALYLKSTGADQIGCIGMSLGGYISALWASLDELAFCVPLVPMVSMAEVAWEILSRNEDFQRMQREGLTIELLHQYYHVHCPLSHQVKIPKNRLFIVAGIGDEIMPPRQPKLLWDHWKMPALHWSHGGHVAHIRRSRAFEEVLKFMEKLGYVGVD